MASSSLNPLAVNTTNNRAIVAQRRNQRVRADTPTVTSASSPNLIHFNLSPNNIDLSSFYVTWTQSIINDATTPTTYFTFLHATSAIARVVFRVAGQVVLDLQGQALFRNALYNAFSPATAASAMDVLESTTYGGASTSANKITYDATARTVVYRPFEAAFETALLPLELIGQQAELELYLSPVSDVLNTGATGTPANIGYQLANCTAVYDVLTLTPSYTAQLKTAAGVGNLRCLFKQVTPFTSTFQSTSYSQSAPVQTKSLRQLFCVLRNASNLGASNADVLATYVNGLSSVQFRINGTLFPAQPLDCSASPPTDVYFELLRCQHAWSDEPGLEENSFVFTSTSGATMNFSGITGSKFMIGIDVSTQVDSDVVAGINTVNSAAPVIVEYTMSSTPSYAVRSDVFCVTDRILVIGSNGFQILV